MSETINHQILSMMQCTNLGGMEQSAYFVMENMKLDWRIVTPRPFGPGQSRVLDIDKQAQDFKYEGKFGIFSHNTFKKACDALSQTCTHIWITGADIACLRAALSLNKPILLGHHYHHFEGKSSFIKWKLLYEYFIRNKITITYNTQFTLNEAIKISPWLANQAHVVPYSFQPRNLSTIDKLSAKNNLGIDSNSFVVGNAGWLIERKRWDIFLYTVSLVRERIPNSCFFICGGGPLEQNLRKLADSLNLSDCVYFVGWQQDLAKYYSAFDVLLFNSDFDALGRTPGEAMCYGAIPVASVLYGGLNELVFHGVNGFLIDHHDASKLAEYIFNLYSSPNLIYDCQEAANQTLVKNHSLKASTQFYYDWFNF